MIADVLREHLQMANTPSKCMMGKWMTEQSEDVQDLFAQLASKPTLNVMALYHSLEAELPFRFTTFKLHLKGKCTCPKV